MADQPHHPEQHSALKAASSTTPKVSSPLATPASPTRSAIARHRPGYTRVPSISIVEEEGVRKQMETSGEDDITHAPRRVSTDGLGIAYGTGNVSQARQVSIQSIARIPPEKRSPEQQTSGPADPLISPPLFSPPSTGGLSGSTRFSDSPTDFDTSYGGAKRLAKQSVSSLHSSIQPSLYAKSEAGLLSVRSRYDEWEPHHNCRSHKPAKQNWLSVGILVLAVFSTFLSAAFLIVALRGPAYGRRIRTNGMFTAASAAFLTSVLAKLIELSFVTVLVAFLGQALCRRAYKQQTARGVTLAELNMRSWITQPGSMVTNWHTVRYAGISYLGGIAIVGALSAMLYTSAATALVQPQLRWPKWTNRAIWGLVKTEFANPTYIQGNCKTPISKTTDPEYYDSTCVQMEHAAMGYHNYFSYLSTWTDVNNNGTGSSDPVNRPKGYALLYDNTTVTAPWIETVNMTDLYTKYNIFINNVSMAMPHPGVIQASVDPRNNIGRVVDFTQYGRLTNGLAMQPGDLDGLGTYNIRASVPSPVVHVLCASLNDTQLAPLINVTGDPDLNGTGLNEIFGWGPAYGEHKWPPVFDRMPYDYNTIINDTTGIPYGRDSIYVLGKSGPANLYGLCGLKVSLTPYCSTTYNASSSGATMEATCEDVDDKLTYKHSLTNATSGNFSINNDWPNIASMWARSLALNDGLVDKVGANGSNSRLLTELILSEAELNRDLPSMAEALAVMAGCTLLSSALDSPFVEFYNYSGDGTLSPGQYQLFNASVRAQQYASGGTVPYQKVFFPVLVAVFVLNAVALGYFTLHREWITDFSEPANMFSLAVNSPPSKELAGCCGGGPEGEHFKVNWKLSNDGEHVFLESLEQEEEDFESLKRKKRRISRGLDMMMNPVRKASGRFSTK